MARLYAIRTGAVGHPWVRRGFRALIAGAVIAGLGGTPPILAQQTQPALKVTITAPADDQTSLFINQTAEMAVRVENGVPAGKPPGGAIYNYAGKSVVPPNYTIAWTASMGSFMESYAPTTTFMNVSDIDGGVDNLLWWASAVEETAARPAIPASQPAPAATGPARPEVQPKPPLGNPGAMFIPDELQKEIAAALGAPDRDARVARLRIALAQRAGDPWAIVLEFDIATLLGQNPDPDHHQEVHPEESLAVLRRIVEHYDHKVYYNSRAIGETCSPRFMVPRAAIIAASFDNGLLHDFPDARAYALTAMDDLDWTFRKRTQDWAEAPRPAPLGPMEQTPTEEAKYNSRVAGWEKDKRDAAAGLAIGPYEKELAEAAVRQYGLSYGPQRPDEVAPIMQRLIERYPKSPIATAAQGHIDRARAPATQPATPPSPQ